MTTPLDHNTFDPHQFMDDLIQKMGLKDADPAKKEQLKNAMFDRLNQEILDAVSMALEPSVVDDICARYKEETDPLYFIRQLIAASPAAQKAVMEAIDRFYKQTLEAHKNLT